MMKIPAAPLPEMLSAAFLLIVTTFFSGLILSGCSNDNPSAQLVVAEKATRPVKISGLVSNSNGAVKSGKIIAKNSNGKTVATSTWENRPKYTIEIPEGTQYPLEIIAVIKKKKLKVAVISPTTSEHDISPLTTKIADLARSLGGYTVKNITQASLTTTEIPGEDRTVGGFKGDPTKRFGGWH